MTRKFSILSVGLIAFSSAVFAQTGAKKPSSASKKETGIAVAVPLPAPVDPVLLTVGGDAVTKSEFESIYHKNNPKDAPDDRKALEEYLELFVNFKLKVKAAKELGKDTTQAFNNELKGY
jgi:hypothetical protein